MISGKKKKNSKKKELHIFKKNSEKNSKIKIKACPAKILENKRIPKLKGRIK